MTPQVKLQGKGTRISRSAWPWSQLQSQPKALAVSLSALTSDNYTFPCPFICILTHSFHYFIKTLLTKILAQGKSGAVEAFLKMHNKGLLTSMGTKGNETLILGAKIHLPVVHLKHPLGDAEIDCITGISCSFIFLATSCGAPLYISLSDLAGNIKEDEPWFHLSYTVV